MRIRLLVKPMPPSMPTTPRCLAFMHVGNDAQL